MAEIIAISSLAVFGIGYGIKSLLNAKKNLKKRQPYRDMVNEYTVRRGHPVQNNYEVFEAKLESGEIVLNSPRIPENNETYNEIKVIYESYDDHGNYIHLDDIEDEYDILSI